MKKTLYFIFAAALVLGMTSCDKDFLTKVPETYATPESYFKTNSDFELWANNFYRSMDSPESLAEQMADDHISVSLPQIQKGTRTPFSETWSWTNLRNINYLLEHMDGCEDEELVKTYTGVACFFRALFYYGKVGYYGDVPYYDHTIASDNEEDLKKARDSRTFVMKKVIDDLDVAIANLPDEWDHDPEAHVNKYVALAAKSRIALFEGTFHKYHNVKDENLDGINVTSQWFLEQAADAAKKVMDTGKYGLYKKDDLKLDPSQPSYYREYFLRTRPYMPEDLMIRVFDFENLNQGNSIQIDFKQRNHCATRKMVNHYLQADGKPIQERSGWETESYYDQFQGRDPRLAQSIQGPSYVKLGEDVTIHDWSESMNGYNIIKFVGSSIWDHSGTANNTYAFYRYPEVLLNYAEAKAELGTLTQADIDATINVIRDRVDMPHLTMPTTPDVLMKEYYPNAKGTQLAAILEIRRERTVELFSEGFRQKDLIRWAEGKWLTPKTTNGYQGIYIEKLGEQDFDKDGKPDVYFYDGEKPSSVDPNIKAYNVLGVGSTFKFSEGDHGYLMNYFADSYVWDESRDYLWPIPVDQRVATGGNLTQNPGYDDGLSY